MMGAGTLGVARRHWDITFTDAPLSVDVPGTAFLMMGLNGVSAILAAVGGVAYIVIVVGSILFGERRTEEVAKANPVIYDGGDAITQYGSEATVRIPGTIVLVSIFFTTFVLYYFVNWKYLSEVWPLR
jgi:cytochrome c oxidase subunit 1